MCLQRGHRKSEGCERDALAITARMKLMLQAPGLLYLELVPSITDPRRLLGCSHTGQEMGAFCHSFFPANNSYHTELLPLPGSLLGT